MAEHPGRHRHCRTKTLAKIANRIAKKSEKAKGVLDLYKSKYQDVALDRTLIGDVWGIGRSSVRKLETINIKTAATKQKRVSIAPYLFDEMNQIIE